MFIAERGGEEEDTIYLSTPKLFANGEDVRYTGVVVALHGKGGSQTIRGLLASRTFVKRFVKER